MSIFSEQLTVISTLAETSVIARSGSVRLMERVQCAAAKAGTVTSGTADRLLTLGADHGIIQGAIVGVFWSAGQRIDMEVSAVGSTTITVAAADGAGDAFPANTTAITVGVRVESASVAFLATNMQMLSVSAKSRAGVDLVSSVPASLLAVKIAAGECYEWASGTGPANPITGTVAAANCYNGATAAAEILIGVLIT